MRDLPGNDYVALSKFRTEGVHETQSVEGMTDATLIAAALDANTQATLALAFEQRTANLIATADLHASLGRSGLAYPIMEHLNARLGLGES